MLILAASLAFIPNLSHASSLPDLCDDVYLDADGVPIHDAKGMTFSRYCEWTGPDAPWWGAAVCCSFDAAGAHCTVPDSRGCEGAYEMWCDHGEQASDGSVTCYQPFPDICDSGFCLDAPAGAEQGDAVPVCCIPGDGCYEVDFGDNCPGGYLGWCYSPYTNEDGTVGCADD